MKKMKIHPLCNSSKGQKRKDNYHLSGSVWEKYFRTEDYIVFTVSLISFVWICLYQLYWTTEQFSEPLFRNAYEWGIITFAIFSSLIASGSFYLFTIFIPRVFRINRMSKELESVLNNINTNADTIINQIKIGDSESFYTLMSFQIEIRKEKSKVQADFMKFYKSINDFDYFYETISYQIEEYKYIMSIYSTLLPRRILNLITEITTSSFYALKMKPKSVVNYSENQTFSVLSLVVITSNLLKTYYKK